MFEKKLAAVPPQAFTANGTTSGQVTVADASLFTVKQQVNINSSTLPELIVEVKRITDLHTMFVGPIGGSIDNRSDVSAYTTADTATISAVLQNRPNIPEQAVERATYQDEPVVARRVIIVDKLGNKIDETNPLPVAATFDGDVKVGDIRITADDDPVVGDLHSSVRIGDGTNEAVVTPHGSLATVKKNSLVGVEYDALTLAYDPSQNLSSVVYTLASVTVATLTLTYDGNQNLISVTST